MVDRRAAGLDSRRAGSMNPVPARRLGPRVGDGRFPRRSPRCAHRSCGVPSSVPMSTPSSRDALEIPGGLFGSQGGHHQVDAGPDASWPSGGTRSGCTTTAIVQRHDGEAQEVHIGPQHPDAHQDADQDQAEGEDGAHADGTDEVTGLTLEHKTAAGTLFGSVPRLAASGPGACRRPGRLGWRLARCRTPFRGVGRTVTVMIL